MTAVLVTAIIGVIASGLVGVDGVARLVQLRDERQTLLENAVARMAENERLRDAIQRLRTDRSHLETLARQELGLVRPDEIVYRFRDRPGGR